jgi:protein-disulfide isomerase
MRSRQDHKLTAREARVASETRGQAAATRGSRLRLLYGIFTAAAAAGAVVGGSQSVIVEFADLPCPYCEEYTVQTLPTLVPPQRADG